MTVSPQTAGVHSIFDGAGASSAGIAGLWWLMFWICLIVFVLVMAALTGALLRRFGPVEGNPTRYVAGAIGLTAAVLFVFLFASMATGRSLASLTASPALTLEVTGHQWWWQVDYLDAHPDRRVSTANEIHIPIGRPIRIRAVSRDVIHSIWVPSLAGKRDLIPGHDTELWLRADRPGTYRGQCAEFCGEQHAHMALLVIAERPEAFARWLGEQRRSAQPPADPDAKRGATLFLQLQCALCHSVKGTLAGGKAGPDLTHLARRRTLAAGTLGNTPLEMKHWIADPQTIKPGSAMPATSVSPRDLDALVSYLETLR